MGLVEAKSTRLNFEAGAGVTMANDSQACTRVRGEARHTFDHVGPGQARSCTSRRASQAAPSVKIKSAEFKTSATDVASCPKWAVPEFGFVGRSNVGKSSLINMLTGRHALAKVSATPGKTKLLNFFLINNEWGLVDMPGYGYAAVGKERRADFGDMIAAFVSERPNLKRVFVLIDSRLEPQRIDLEFLQWLEGTAMPFALIFTKADKLGPVRLQANIEDYKKTLGTWRSVMPDILVSSAEKGTGRTDILHYIEAKLGEPDEPAEPAN